MKPSLPLVTFALVSVLVLACNRSPQNSAPPEAPHSDAETASSCTSGQFVACETGQACARRKGVLLTSKPCFDRAADACATLGCKHGCDLYHGTPKEVHCAVNAASSSNMKRCGGHANWACPEKMRCDILAPSEAGSMHPTGTCVADGT